MRRRKLVKCSILYGYWPAGYLGRIRCKSGQAGLRNVAELAVAEGDTGHNEPFAVDADMYYAAIVAADKIGTDARAKRNA